MPRTEEPADMIRVVRGVKAKTDKDARSGKEAKDGLGTGTSQGTGIAAVVRVPQTEPKKGRG